LIRYLIQTTIYLLLPSYQVGINVNQIPANRPIFPVSNYQRDGAFAGVCPISGGANFYPNDRVEQGTPAPDE